MVLQLNTSSERYTIYLYKPAYSCWIFLLLTWELTGRVCSQQCSLMASIFFLSKFNIFTRYFHARHCSLSKTFVHWGPYIIWDVILNLVLDPSFSLDRKQKGKKIFHKKQSLTWKRIEAIY
jgi:hypothetical protein